MKKKNKCRKCKNMLNCLLYEIGQEDMCDYKPHRNLICRIFGHKYDKTIWHDEVFDLPQQTKTQSKRTRRHLYFYKCVRCNHRKYLTSFQKLKIFNM